MDETIKEKANYCLNCKNKPCQKGCPLHNDIPGFIKMINEENYKEAYELLTETTVLQPICGRICPHTKQCQGSCVRGIKSKPVSIGELEAYVGDLAIRNNWKITKNNVNKDGKVAIVGAGPSGLTCAAFLAREGYKVTIYEKNEKLGGILEYGIPDFRLPKEIIKKAIEKILELGIEVITNCELGKDISLSQLKDKYDAIYLSFGANKSLKMNIPGEELIGVYGANEILEKNNHPDYKNKNVAVIGGGNVAIDMARTAKKLGAKTVSIIYRRSEEQMPAEKKEIEDAKNEEIQFLFKTNIIGIMGRKEVEQIECVKTELIKKETDDRLSPVNIEGSNFKMEINYVMMAIGSKADEELTDSLDIELIQNGKIKIDENNKTSKKNVFAGGDLAGVKQTVAEAANSGKDAAKNIDKFLKNKKK